MKRIVLGFFILFAPAVWAMEPQDTKAPADIEDAAMPCPDIPEKIKKEVPHCCKCGAVEHLWRGVFGSIKYICGNCLDHLSMKWN